MAKTGDQDRDALIAQASDWLARLDAGRAVPEDFEAWRAVDPRRAAAFAEVAAAWSRLDALRDVEPRTRPAVTRRAWLGGGLALAAGVAGAAYVGRDQLLRVRTVTGIGERRTLALPDGSSVELNTDTIVAWRFDRQRRRLWLERGEIALTIAHDALRPFELFTHEGLARLASGQFNARLRPAGLDLIVLAGRAAIKTAAGEAEAAVEAATDARQALAVSAAGVSVAAAPEAEVQNVQAWRRGEIVFEGQRLTEAVEEYNRYLTRKLVIEDPKVGALRLGGRFLTDNPETFLEALRTTFGLRIIADDPSRILLKSR
ncbi:MULTISPECIES: FecR domain-containing protein [unclassified Caulobacter]|uniref:FecR family protein n=1 Tax=unclassified Caulobacter TaxID=2648921 RepID=UPI0006F5FE02|nr:MULTISPECIES: FecR domain-containing protein [unclassified Caulobacter]KQV57638.1 iron dicitrate transport regulator FecR [Caulobacter sp. Root342]KQV67211.1 iron dicitrate transport regulator FecR [Caulobacter sp. Root343]